MSDAQSALSRINLRHTFVMPETADIFVSNLTQFAQINPERAETIQAAHMASVEQAYGYGQPRADTERKPFIYNDGMAIIPIHGALLNRFGGAYSFATGYNYIRRMMNAALEDDDVNLIVFDVDSPGGEAAGCFELAEEIRESRASKPSIAVVDSLAASAGYALASAATRMVATPSSKIGSIGVIAMHMNMAGMLDRMGVKVTFIEAPEGGLKSAGSPYKDLSDEAKADFQNGVNKTYDDFVALVVANRGMDADAVRGTKAKVFRSDEALALRLIDEVNTPSDAVSDFVAELADETDPIESEDEEMTTAAKKTDAAAPAAGSEATSAAPAAPVVDVQAAIAADRERMSQIKALPEAAKRPALADKIALMGTSVEDAKSILEVAAEETPAAAAAAPATTEATSGTDTTNHLANAMDATQQPNVGAGGGTAPVAGAGAEPTSEDLAASILKDQGAVVGRNYGEAPKA